jgi:hypothetical protein
VERVGASDDGKKFLVGMVMADCNTGVIAVSRGSFGASKSSCILPPPCLLEVAGVSAVSQCSSGPSCTPLLPIPWMSMAGALGPHVMPQAGGAIGKCGVILGIGDSSAESGKDRDGETWLPSLWSCCVTLCPHFRVASTVHVRCNYK